MLGSQTHSDFKRYQILWALLHILYLAHTNKQLEGRSSYNCYFYFGHLCHSEWPFLSKWWLRNKSYIFKIINFMAIKIIAFYWNCIRSKLLSWFSLNEIQEQIHFLLCSKKSGPLQGTVQCVKLHSESWTFSFFQTVIQKIDFFFILSSYLIRCLLISQVVHSLLFFFILQTKRFCDNWKKPTYFIVFYNFIGFISYIKVL